MRSGFAHQFLRNLAADAGVETALDSQQDAATSALCAASQLDVGVAAIEGAAGGVMGISSDASIVTRPPSAAFLELIPIAYARRHAVLGFAADGGAPLPLAVATPFCAGAVDVVGRLLARPVTPVLVPADVLLPAINRAYQQRMGQADALIRALDREEVLNEVVALGAREDLLDSSSRAPVIKLVNLLIFEAVKLQASDVHVQPYEDRLVIRMRIDGILFDAFSLARSLQDEVVSRIKVMARMNIAEKRLAQDGRASVQVGDRAVDLRVASLPTNLGERVVIRLLDKGARLYDLDELGMERPTLASFRRIIGHEHGLILVTGPTGSGKSTTLYAALQQINTKQKNVLTLEDPIEYQLHGISQSQVATRKGMTFASGLRSVLRQDPDIIMVGEIRDQETAVMAIQSALTGHLVFSTLHTNDAASAVARLLDLGIEPYLVSSSVVAVLAQRLVRVLCADCATACTPTTEQLCELGVALEQEPTATLRAPGGCAACRQTGYRGRIGIFELLPMTEVIRELIQRRAGAGAIKAEAIRGGMTSLRDHGLLKAFEGVTTLDEVIRVTLRFDT